jgi:alpha-tubulin suppressor-like RCC1 family protein
MSVLLAVGAAVGAAALPAAAVDTPTAPLTVGADDLGQQGNGIGGARLVPGSMSGPAATSIASGRDHGYLLDEQGRVWGWGDNGFGQVGDGTNTVRQAPVLLPQLSSVQAVEVEAGHYHGLAVDSSGRLWVWGFGTLGQLGQGTTGNSPTPRLVPGLTEVSHAVGGRDMSYALLTDGTVRAFGDNLNGEMGDGTTTRRTSPVQVPGLTGIVELSAGRNHALALDNQGRIWAWGDNAYGQVGNGTTVDVRQPTLVASGYVHVDAGAHHSLAVRSDGQVATWGRGYRGQLGLGNTAMRTSPTIVPGLTGIVEVGDGRDQSFALTEDGRVYAWGSNAAGQLGDGTTSQRNSPVWIGLTGIAVAQSGSSHSVFLPKPEPSGNLPPTASFTASCTNLTCTFDASASRDPDGTYISYAWDFGDGTTNTFGPGESRTYAAGGSYTVTLTVTDEYGLTGTTSRQANVSAIVFAAGVGASATARTHRARIPNGVQPGDTMLLTISVNSGATVAEPTGVTGWTPVQSVSGGDYSTRVWVKTAQAGDPTSTISVVLSASAHGTMSMLAYRAPGPVGVLRSASALETTSRTGHTTPTASVPTGGGRLVSIWSVKSTTTTTMTPPAGVQQRSLLSNSSTNHITMLIGESVAPVGTAGGLTAVANTAAAKATMVSVVLAQQ